MKWREVIWPFEFRAQCPLTLLFFFYIICSLLIYQTRKLARLVSIRIGKVCDLGSNPRSSIFSNIIFPLIFTCSANVQVHHALPNPACHAYVESNPRATDWRNTIGLSQRTCTCPKKSTRPKGWWAKLLKETPPHWGLQPPLVCNSPYFLYIFFLFSIFLFNYLFN